MLENFDEELTARRKMKWEVREQEQMQDRLKQAYGGRHRGRHAKTDWNTAEVDGRQVRPLRDPARTAHAIS